MTDDLKTLAIIRMLNRFDVKSIYQQRRHDDWFLVKVRWNETTLEFVEPNVFDCLLDACGLLVDYELCTSCGKPIRVLDVEPNVVFVNNFCIWSYSLSTYEYEPGC